MRGGMRAPSLKRVRARRLSSTLSRLGATREPSPAWVGIRDGQRRANRRPSFASRASAPLPSSLSLSQAAAALLTLLLAVSEASPVNETTLLAAVAADVAALKAAGDDGDVRAVDRHVRRALAELGVRAVPHVVQQDDESVAVHVCSLNSFFWGGGGGRGDEEGRGGREKGEKRSSSLLVLLSLSLSLQACKTGRF